MTIPRGVGGAAATTSIHRGSRRVTTTSVASRSCRPGRRRARRWKEWTLSIQGVGDEAGFVDAGGELLVGSWRERRRRTMRLKPSAGLGSTAPAFDQLDLDRERGLPEGTDRAF